jgi:hypothetical protein
MVAARTPGPENSIWYYERLQGDLMMIYAKSSNNRYAYIVHVCKAVTDRKYPFDELVPEHKIASANPSVYPNSERVVMSVGKKDKLFPDNVLICKDDPPIPNSKLHAMLQAISDFANTNRFSPSGTKELISVPPSWPKRYFVAPQPDTTQNPKRKLGDIVTISSAIAYLQSIVPQAINHNTYNNPLFRPYIHEYFSQPYHHTLACLGIPPSELSPLEYNHDQPAFYDPEVDRQMNH